MDEFFGGIFVLVFIFSAFGAIDNMLNQTPDSRIVDMCRDKGYLNVKQIVIKCSIEKNYKGESE